MVWRQVQRSVYEDSFVIDVDDDDGDGDVDDYGDDPLALMAPACQSAAGNAIRHQADGKVSFPDTFRRWKAIVVAMWPLFSSARH